jgi:hypothetical protein
MNTPLTTKQIKQLRDEALAANDLITADLCTIALSGEDSDGAGTTLGTPCTLAQALAKCERVIANARAQDDEVRS